MVTLAVFLGVLVAVVITLVWVVLRRGNGSTDHAEGLLIEEARRQQAYRDRQSFGTFAQHNMPPSMGDYFHTQP
ncbi:hypothetical protein ACFWXK_02475 [Streptomyces sp. NPDC059070]|uniref:hypothetical protein n=1 Tax=unclassified Streptomyces TaxID=2593676 RepID=UPI0034E2F0A4